MAWDRSSSINYLINRINRKHAIIFFSENCQISRAYFQFLADWTITFGVDAMTRRATRLIFCLANIDYLSRCVRTKRDDRIGKY